MLPSLDSEVFQASQYIANVASCPELSADKRPWTILPPIVSGMPIRGREEFAIVHDNIFQACGSPLRRQQVDRCDQLAPLMSRPSDSDHSTSRGLSEVLSYFARDKVIKARKQCQEANPQSFASFEAAQKHTPLLPPPTNCQSDPSHSKKCGGPGSGRARCAVSRRPRWGLAEWPESNDVSEERLQRRRQQVREALRRHRANKRRLQRGVGGASDPGSPGTMDGAAGGDLPDQEAAAAPSASVKTAGQA